MIRQGFGWRGWTLVAAGCLLLVLLVGLRRPAAAPTPAPTAVQVEHGLASYYGAGFHGQKTASGEVFDQQEMVAAHRTLPLGTVVRVTNLENKRQVVLRVIDRGPYGANYRKGTIVDVSKGAAERLRFLSDGLVRVRLEVVKKPV